jgi:Na+-transporting NADH:ubiquinone oxidoreductase subunit NqrB
MSNRALDPRWFQIGSLAGLLGWGLLGLEFDVARWHVPVLLGTALATQWICTRLWKLPRFEPKSALISGLSLCLLLRTNHPHWAMVVAVVAIASKFALRWRGKHVFNPTNIGIVVALLAGVPVWASPGQWGSGAFFGFLLACAGTVVVTRAARADITLAFLAAVALIQFGRAAWLGQPWAVPLHRLENGALLLFAFFMISDPRTTPDSRAGRILFAFLVALGAAFVQFVLYRSNGLLWSLAAWSLAVPLLDWMLPARRYVWNAVASPEVAFKGVVHVTKSNGPVDSSPVLVRGRAGGRLLWFLRRQGGCQALQQGVARRLGA